MILVGDFNRVGTTEERYAPSELLNSISAKQEGEGKITDFANAQDPRSLIAHRSPTLTG